MELAQDLMYSVCLLDLDGTLSDSLDLMRELYYSFLARHGAIGSQAGFETCNGMSLDEIVDHLRALHRLEGSASALLMEYRQLMAENYPRATLNPEAPALLAALRRGGFRVGLVTSAAPDVAVAFLSAHRVLAQFDHVIGHTSGMRGKPFPDLYLAALHHFGVSPDAALGIEDSMAGVLAGRSAGIHMVQLCPGQPAALGTIGRLSEVMDILSLRV